MLAEIASTVDAAIGSRDWWDGWGDAAAWAVAAGVILESVADFETLARLVRLAARPRLRDGIAKFGLSLLIVALVAEVVIARHVKETTDTIESSLTAGMNRAVVANADLAGKIEVQKHDLATAKTDLAATQGQISSLGGKENALKVALATDEKARRAMLEQLKPRDLTKAQVATIGAAIKGHVDKVYMYALADPDAMQFVFALAEAIRAGGGHPVLMLDTSQNPPRFWKEFNLPISQNGVTVYESPAEPKKGILGVLGNAFVKAKVVDLVSDSEQSPFPNVPTPAIFVGLKSEPFSQFPAYATPPFLEKWLKKHPPAWNPK